MRQTDINDLIQDAIKDEARRFVDIQYVNQREEDSLPLVRNRHEAYGLMMEFFQTAAGAMDSVKAAMEDCTRALTGTDMAFQEAAENTFNSLLDTCIAVTAMGVQTLNVIYKIAESIASNVTPMEQMVNTDTDELPE